MGATDYGTRVWEGDPTTVAEARKRYEADPQEGLMPYAVALYSFRNQKHLVDELIALWRQLVYRAARLMNPALTAPSAEVADEADVLATHLEWISRQATLEEGLRERVRKHAQDICYYGIRISDPKSAGHTLPLLYLTAARLRLDDDKSPQALDHLRTAQNVIASGEIADSKQRVRVYAKLGLLYRKCGERGVGIAWGIRALLVGEVPMNARLKALAALLGVDR